MKTINKVRLRPTTPDDLEYVFETEYDLDNRNYILQWTIDQHLEAIHDPSIAHFIVETLHDQKPVGYAILLGVGGVHENIELTRLAFSEKGKGYGRQMLRLVKEWAFEEQGANRLELDVINHNERARHLYLSEGFVEEGLKREAVKFGDKLESIYMLSMLKREYEQAKKG